MSEDKINILQATINKRAEAKLDDDLAAIWKMVEEHDILSRSNDMPTLKIETRPAKMMDGKVVEPAKMESMTIRSILRYATNGYRPVTYASSVFMDQVRAALLPEYINKMTADFLARIDKLEEDVDYLKDNAKMIE